MLAHLFDTTTENVHEVDVDNYEAVSFVVVVPQLKPTEKQFAFLKKLFAERSQNEEAQILRAHLLSELKAGRMSRTMASEAIGDILLIQPDVKGTKTQQQSLPDLEHGQIWITGDGFFVKVALNQQGTSFYGKVWDRNSESWVYQPGALKSIDHRCTAAEAKEFSLQWDAEHRNCIFCMRHLSDERSEFAGYGETCAENNGLPWGATA